MNITAEERQELIQDVVNEITTQSTSIDELPVIDDLAKTESLPAYEKGSSKLVQVPIQLLAQPALNAADTANTAASSANSAAALAEAAKNAANDAATKANAATTNANQAAALATQTIETINSIKTTADSAKTSADKLVSQIGDLIIKVTTEGGYSQEENKEQNTLYLCTEDETE